MKQIKAKIDFSLNGTPYLQGEEIQIKDFKTLVTLNEKGFIEPLNYKDLVLIEREIKEKNKEL